MLTTTYWLEQFHCVYKWQRHNIRYPTLEAAEKAQDSWNMGKWKTRIIKEMNLSVAKEVKACPEDCKRVIYSAWDDGED